MKTGIATSFAMRKTMCPAGISVISAPSRGRYRHLMLSALIALILVAPFLMIAAASPVSAQSMQPRQQLDVCYYDSWGNQHEADWCIIGGDLSSPNTMHLSPHCRAEAGARCILGNSGQCRHTSKKFSQYVIFPKNSGVCPATFNQAVARSGGSGGGGNVVTPTCPSGFVLSGNQCVRDAAPAPSCPSGFIFSQGQCVRGANPSPPTYTPPPAAALYPREVQTNLRRLGCLRGSVDGVWGPGSRAALQRFSNLRNSGLPRNTSEPTQRAFDATVLSSAPACPTVNVAPQPPTYQPPVTKKLRCSKIKFAFTRGNSCACSGGRIFTGSACVKPRQQASPQQCVKRCEAIGAQCHRKLTQLGDAKGWDGDLRQDYWDDNCAPKVNSCKVGCNPKGPMRPGECRYMADGEQVCS